VRALLVDDAVSLADLFASELRRVLHLDVRTVSTLAAVPEVLAREAPFDLAIVDLSFPLEHATGLDALAEIRRTSPSTRLVVLTQGDEWVADTLRDAWDLLPLATVLSKTTRIDQQLATIEQVLRVGTAPPDPTIQPLLPSGPPGGRQDADFSRLVQHQGHAKLWSALLAAGDGVTYRTVAHLTGLKLNTVKNYRSQLVPELARHGLVDPSLVEMQSFAIRCRGFLRPHLAGREPTAGASAGGAHP
jgi:DNA-binding NarL/FixJ family response regulator